MDSIDFCIANLEEIESFAEEVRSDGFTDVILLGMGGSALAPEVFAQVFPQQEAGLNLKVLDTTCSNQITDFEKKTDLSKTLFIAASKSGSTIETWSLFEYFFEKIQALKGEKAGENFVVITDPGSDLQATYEQRNLRYCFKNPADIGGRFSALSFFGLVPAALLGISVKELLESAHSALNACMAGDGEGVQLGEWLVDGYFDQSLDKLQLNVSDELEPIVWWIEQLIAESLGKKEFGIFPFVNKEKADKGFAQTKILSLKFGTDDSDFSNQSNATMYLKDYFEIAACFFHWEFATAIAGSSLGINPFDEPNVTEAKMKTKALLSEYVDADLPIPDQTPLEDLLKQVTNDSYLAILAYWPINQDNYDSLHSFRKTLEAQINIPISVNFGPRYLHSTGQLHKGGKRQGLFIVLTQKQEPTLEIPNQSFDFSRLCSAQALGDYQILTEKLFPASYYELSDLADLSSLL